MGSNKRNNLKEKIVDDAYNDSIHDVFHNIDFNVWAKVQTNLTFKIAGLALVRMIKEQVDS